MLANYPAWIELNPGLPKLWAVNTPKSNALLKALDANGQLYSVEFSFPNNAHLVLKNSNHVLHYIKLIPEKNSHSYLEHDVIAQWLQEYNINACACIVKKLFQHEGENYLVMVYPYWEGVRVSSSNNDLSVLAKSIAQLHLTLKNHPETKKWQGKTEQRYKELEYIRKKIIKGECHFRENMPAVIALAKQYNFDCWIDTAQAQSLHGDLNPGNVLLVENSLVFFDFEDTAHSYLPVIVELGYIIERFIMILCTDKEIIVQKGREFLKIYREAGGYYQYLKWHSSILDLLALKAFCVLTYCYLNNIGTEPKEWNKFLYLLNRAKDKNYLLKRILSS